MGQKVILTLHVLYRNQYPLMHTAALMLMLHTWCFCSFAILEKSELCGNLVNTKNAI